MRDNSRPKRARIQNLHIILSFWSGVWQVFLDSCPSNMTKKPNIALSNGFPLRQSFPSSDWFFSTSHPPSFPPSCTLSTSKTNGVMSQRILFEWGRLMPAMGQTAITAVLDCQVRSLSRLLTISLTAPSSFCQSCKTHGFMFFSSESYVNISLNSFAKEKRWHPLIQLQFNIAQFSENLSDILHY